MAGETAFPRHEYFSESLPAAQVIVRLIEETMTEAGTHDQLLAAGGFYASLYNAQFT